MIEDVVGHLDLLEDRPQLHRTGPDVPIGRVAEHRADLVEIDAVAAVVTVERAKAQLTSREDVGDDLGDFFHLIVVVGTAHVEDLVVHLLDRRVEHHAQRLRDVERVHQRPPRAAVAVHRDGLRRPREARQVVDHDVEAHPRGRPERGRIAHEGRREVVVGHRREVTLDHDLAFGVGGLWIGGIGLGHVGARRHAVDRARGHVDESPRRPLALPGGPGALNPCGLCRR